LEEGREAVRRPIDSVASCGAGRLGSNPADPKEDVMRKLALLPSLLALGALGLVACGGGDDGGTTAVAESGTTSNEERIKQQGNRWAVAFAKDGPVPCLYMGQPACELANCEHVPNEPIENCMPPSAEFRDSFTDATVERVVIEGYHATAEFSNGESVEFEGQEADGGDAAVEHSAWFVTKNWVKEAEEVSEP
jgi:hypothetical protein